MWSNSPERSSHHEISPICSLTRMTPCSTFQKPRPVPFPPCAGATAFRIRWIPAPSTTGSTRSCGQPLTGERSPKDYVTLERFVRFFQALKLPRDPDKCNRDYLTALGAGGLSPASRGGGLPGTGPPGAQAVHRHQRCGLRPARSRLQGSVFADLITDAFISEDAGASKPDPAYYAYVRSAYPA